ncbi:MAG: FtsQ-type POTRA domain-containing protein [Puniceicoccales bacterium]|nr:FtsQ-type POTRA domain-containing protein [Puniceicoccales bacterium]
MRLKSIIKGLFFATIFVAAIEGLYFFEKGLVPKQVPQTHLPLRSISFSSDGAITARWLAKALAIKKGTPLADVDIFSLKKRLLEFSQIRDVCIEKQFPDALDIRVKERHPLLKFATKGNGREELLFVDSLDGSIFRAACMPKNLILATPYTDLRVEKFSGSPLGIRGVTGIEAVAYFISAVREKYPEIHGQIRKFSLEKYDHRSGATWSRIEIFLKNGLIVAFSPQDIDAQLLHFAYLLQERNLARMSIRKIDLARINCVIMEDR